MKKFTFSLTIALFLLSCNNQPPKKENTSVDFMDSAQINFRDTSMHFYRVEDSALNDISKLQVRRQQEQWMKEHFVHAIHINNWVGTFNITHSDTSGTFIEIEDFARVKFYEIVTPLHTKLIEQIGKIPDSSLVQFSGLAAGILDFEYDPLLDNPAFHDVTKIGVPRVVIILDSIKKLPVKY